MDIYGHNVFHRPHPVFSSTLYVHVSEMLCTFQRCCARVRVVVHVSQQLCTFHRSCAPFTSSLVMFVFNCIGATKHVLPINIYGGVLKIWDPQVIMGLILSHDLILDALELPSFFGNLPRYMVPIR